jgi:hypothetical protein
VEVGRRHVVTAVLAVVALATLIGWAGGRLAVLLVGAP